MYLSTTATAKPYDNHLADQSIFYQMISDLLFCATARNERCAEASLCSRRGGSEGSWALPFFLPSVTHRQQPLAGSIFIIFRPTHPVPLTRDCLCQSCDHQEPRPPTNPNGEFPSHPIAHSLSDHKLFRVVQPLPNPQVTNVFI